MELSGILTLPAEQYRAADGVSKSMLDWLAPREPNRHRKLPGGTPAHFRARWLTGEIADEETPATRMGRLVHRVILEPDSLAGAFHVRPAGLHFTTKEGREWKAAHEDRPILTAEEAQTVTRMRDAVWRHPMARRLLHGAETERSLFAADADGTLRKGRLDALTRGNVIPDLKTGDCAAPDAFAWSLADYRYHVQAAYYLDLCGLVGLEKETFVFICVEKAPPYAVACYQLAPEDIEMGRAEYRRDLALYRHCVAENHWPAYGEGVELTALPERVRKGLEALA